MNTNKKTYITPAVKEYEMGTLSVFAGSAAMYKGHWHHHHKHHPHWFQDSSED